MNPSRRQRWLGGALVATLGATALTAWWGGDPESTDDLAPPRSHSERSPSLQKDRRSLGPMTQPTASPPSTPIATMAQRQRADWPAVPVAALAAWGHSSEPAPRSRPVAARAAQAASAASAPVAPPLAYRYVGRILEDGRRRAMLVSPQRSILVEENELIEGHWRVERIDDAEIRWLWLPGALPGRLAFAS
jgi:hypothetical protein